MYFLNRNTYTAPLFKDSNILKFSDKIAHENCIFIENYFNQTLPTPSHKTKIFGKQSINIDVSYI